MMKISPVIFTTLTIYQLNSDSVRDVKAQTYMCDFLNVYMRVNLVWKGRIVYSSVCACVWYSLRLLSTPGRVHVFQTPVVNRIFANNRMKRFTKPI